MTYKVWLSPLFSSANILAGLLHLLCCFPSVVAVGIGFLGISVHWDFVAMLRPYLYLLQGFSVFVLIYALFRGRLRRQLRWLWLLLMLWSFGSGVFSYWQHAQAKPTFGMHIIKQLK